jgi:hypothetical protein
MAAGAARLVERILISERKSVQKIVEAWQGHLVSTFTFECAKRRKTNFVARPRGSTQEACFVLRG